MAEQRAIRKEPRNRPTVQISAAELDKLKSRCIPGMLAGKRVIFVMDEDGKRKSDHSFVFRDMDVSEPSGIVAYPEFFNKICESGIDILIIRNSDELKRRGMMAILIDSLERFRSRNPKSAVIIDAASTPPSEQMRALMDSGLINAIVESPSYSGPARLMQIGAEVLGLFGELPRT